MSNWPFVKQISQILGFLINIFFEFFSEMGYPSIVLSVFFLTLFIKIVLFPVSFQKSKYNTMMPKLEDPAQRVLAKYKNRINHPLSKNKLNVDRGYLLDRYGLKNNSGCLTSLLPLPVFFAMYAIIMDVKKFIPAVSTLDDATYSRAMSFFGLPITDKIEFGINWSLLIPVGVALFYLIDMVQISAMGKVANGGKLQGGIMNALMMASMFYFSTTMPILCSVYWMFKSIIDIIVNFVIIVYVKNKKLEKFEAQVIKKKNKVRVKRGVPLLEVGMA